MAANMTIQTDPYNNTGICLTTRDDEGNAHLHVIDIQALVSWSELLGIEDLGEVLDAILAAEDPGITDDATGVNSWTDPYFLLAYREQSREREALVAHQEGTADDPRSPLLRATLAAHHAVHQPVDGGECAMDRCRREARNSLSVGDLEPTVRTKASSRLPRTQLLRCEGGTYGAELAELLEPYAAEIERLRREFLHECAGTSVNTLADDEAEMIYTAEERDGFAATLRKYGLNPYATEA